MSRRARGAWLFVTMLLGLSMCVSAHADNLEPFEEFGNHVRAAEQVTPLTDNAFGDHVSLYNGSVEFDATDISIPGNNSLPVALGRRFVVQPRLHSMDPGNLGGFGDWDMEVPYIEAEVTTQNGWTLNGGSSNRCSDTTDLLNTRVTQNTWVNLVAPLEKIGDGYQMHIPGVGTQELLVNNQSKSPAYTSHGSYPWVTTGNWKVSCTSSISAAQGASISGQGFQALSPSGVTYTFNFAVIHAAPSVHVGDGYYGGTLVSVYADRERIYLLATRAQDRFGNTVTYSYNGSGQLTSITSSDNPGDPRTISLTWSGGNIATASDGTHTWSYGYSSNTQGTITTTILTSVTEPDQSKWTYAYNSGSLVTSKNPQCNQCKGDGDPPPSTHCQLTPFPNLGTFDYTVGAPSGATATYDFEYDRHYRSGVPDECVDGNPDDLYPEVYTFFDNFTIVSKTISGPGLPTTMSWGYNTNGTYDDLTTNAPGYFHASVAYDPNALVYLPGGSCGGSNRTSVVTGPTSVIKYTFGTQYGCNEGRLLDVEVDDTNPTNPTVYKTTTNAYVSETQAPNEPFATVAGEPQLPNYVNPTDARLRPVTSTQIAQDGATFTSTVNSFDAFARTTSATASSSLGYSKTSATIYADNTTLWVLGQVSKSTVNSIVASQSDFDSLARPIHGWSFGKLVSTKAWNTDGTLASITDGNNHATTLSSWYRGIPRSVKYADNTTQTATVNAAGWITAVTDENGYATGYGYDPMGRLASISYPQPDDTTWNTTTRTFQQVNNTSEYGIPAGHWKQTVQTGNGYSVTYFDALWRPLVTDTYDSANIAGTRSVSVKRYDAGGRAIFASYPLSSLSSYTSANTGTHNAYDALDRTTEIDQDSELGTLATKTAYLSGFKTQVTDPRGYSTTTSYMVFDAPSTDAPVSIASPESETTTITRDVFGKPTQLVRSGPYGGTTLTMVRSYVYDANQQLCKRIDPESGATAMAYDAAGNLQWSAAGLYLPNTTTCDTATAYSSGRRVDRTFDPRNHLLTLTFPDHRGDQTWSYTADGLPSVIATINAGANTGVTNNYYYDKRRMLRSETQSAYYDYGPYTWALGYAYDANGHRASFSDPTGAGYSFAPNALGQPTQISQSGVALYASGVSYWPDGKLKGYTAGNGVVYSMQENTRLLPSRSTFAGAQAQPASYDSLYTYDADADITQISDAARTNFDRSMTYDGLDRLLGVNAAMLSGQYNYAYDPLDNMRSLAHVGGSTSTYNYDNTGRLTALSNTVAGTTTFSYDVQGNLSAKNGQGYQFDYGNRLRTATGKEDYRYDGLGHRQRADSTSLGEILWMYGQDGKPTWMANRRIGGNAYTYLYLGSQLVAVQEYAGSTLPVHYETTDELDSLIAQTNSDAWVDHFNYYQPWGGLQSGRLDDGPGYANQINDTNTGLSYAQQRYYDPAVPRFMSVDPVDANTVTGSNFNRYVYANDNPYRFTDPDGEQNQDGTVGGEDNPHYPPMCSTGSLTPGGCGAVNVSVTQVSPASPASKINVLGQNVAVHYNSNVSSDNRSTASTALSSAADLLNEHAGDLSGGQKYTIGQINSVSVTGSSKALLGETGGHSMTLSVGYIKAVSVPWLASIFGHEGQHFLNAGLYTGSNLWRDEQTAGRMQLGIGNKIGFSETESQYLQDYIDPSKRDAMQQHMEQGYSQ